MQAGDIVMTSRLAGHSGSGRPRRRPAAPCAAKSGQGAGAARRLSWHFSTPGAAAGTVARPDFAALADALLLALCARDRAYRRCARHFRRLASQCLDAMGLHVACLRAGRLAVAVAYARLAVPWPRPPYRACAYERRGRRLCQRHLARLCRRPHRDGAAALCRLHQPGADVAADSPPLAPALRLRRQCGDGLVRRRPHAAGPIAAPGVRGLRRL